MQTSTLLRFITVFVFVLLIGIFVSYRSGAFSKENIEVADAPIESPSTKFINDTIPSTAKDSAAKDTLKRMLFHGSKSAMVIPENHPSRRRNLKNDSSSIKEKKRRKMMMESSKLGRIIPPNDSNKSKSDTVVVQQKKQ